MKETVCRLHYRGKIKETVTKEMINNAIDTDKHLSIKRHALIKSDKKGLLTEGLFIYKDMLFLYYEAVDDVINPVDLWPTLSTLLYLWPQEKENTPWAKMNMVFYFAEPESLLDFTRKTAPNERCGRIAFLKEETMFDYVYTHRALVLEGAIIGEKWQSIALHENVLFSYYENPRLKEINIKRNLSLESKVIKEWLAMNPADHFDRIDPNNDFLVIPCLYDIG